MDHVSHIQYVIHGPVPSSFPYSRKLDKISDYFITQPPMLGYIIPLLCVFQNSAQSSLKIIRKSSSSIGQVLQEAVTKIEAAQPYYKTISKELTAIMTAVKDCDVQSLKSAYNLIPETIRDKLHPRNALPNVEKGLQILHLRVSSS